MWFISIKLSNFNWLTLTKCFERVSDRDWKARNKLKKRDINDHVPSSFISILFSWYHFNFFFHLILPMSLPLLLLLCYSLKQMVLFDHCIISTYSWHDTYSIYGCILYVLPPNAFCTDLTLLLALSLSQPGALCGVFIPGNVVFINCPSASFVLLAVCVCVFLPLVRQFRSFFHYIRCSHHSEYSLFTYYTVFDIHFVILISLQFIVDCVARSWRRRFWTQWVRENDMRMSIARRTMKPRPTTTTTTICPNW